MDPKRLRAGEWIAGLGSVLLLVALFLPWYEAKNIVVLGTEPLAEEDFTFTGLEAFSAVDLILAAGALAGLGFVALSASLRVSAVNVAASAILSVVAVVVVLLVLFRVLKIPDLSIATDGRRGTASESTRDLGLWLGLAGSGLLLAGALAAMRDERITGDTRSVDPATIETLPAPQPGP
jgi:hypothetical protein